MLTHIKMKAKKFSSRLKRLTFFLNAFFFQKRLVYYFQFDKYPERITVVYCLNFFKTFFSR